MQRKWKRKWQRTVRSIVIASLAATVTLSAYGIGFANPTNPNVTAGSADITTNGATMTITTSDKVSINWDKFNIAGGERVNFVQPNVNSVALNRVIGNEASAIYGTLSANGKVFLINPNGILFAPGSSVNVGGLVASTLNLSDSDFLSGQYKFNGNGASVINQGTISAASGGYVALLGAQAKNQGVILANQGSVVLAGGKAVTLDLANDGFLHLAVDQAALSASVSNGGLIQADGGKVLLSARTADALASTVVNNSGIIRGRSIMNKNGVIVLDGGSGGAINSGTLDASGKDAGQSGGEVKVLGNKVLLAAGSEINVSGDLGGGTALVGGNYQGSGTEQRAVETTVEKGAAIHADAVSNGNGGKVVVWSDGKTMFDGEISARGGAENGSGGSVETSGHDTLNVGDSARVDTSAARGKTGTWLLDPKDFTIAAAGGNMTGAALSANLLTTDMVIQSGNGTTKAGATDSVYVNDAVTWNSAHSLTFQALKNIYVNAAIANNGTGNLTFTPGASGNLLVGKSGSVHFGGSGNLYIAGNQYTLINNLADWNGMAMSGYFALNNDISGVTGAIGGSGASFTGTVDGLGHKVDIGIVSGYGAYTGLFGQNEGTLRNLGVSGTISGNANRVGGLVGYNKGSIRNCYSTVNLNMNSFSDMGGLVGRNYGMAIGTGEIKNSYSTGTLTSNDYGDYAGGLVGNNSHGSIENSYSTANISAANTEYVGGLAGENSGLVDKSYSTGNASGRTVGGLLGRSSGTVTQSFSSGSATGETAGGFVGEVQMNFISNSFWNTTTGGVNGFGTGSAGGAVGKTNAEMQTASTFAGWDQSIWKFYDGSSSPILRSFLKQTVVITAKNNTMIYNGLLYDDSNGVDYSTPVTLLGTLRYTGSTKNVGTYTITPTGLYSNQEGYDLVFASGTLQITPALLTVTATGSDRGYNGTTNANVSYGGWLAGDNLTLSGTAAFADKNAGNNKTVNVSGMSITGGSDAGNYTLANSTTTTTANIAKASLTATATGVDRVYNGTTNANVTYDGWLAGDNLTLSGTAAFADKNAGANKTVNVSGMSITGGSDAGNYTLANSTTTTTANIAKALLTATATGVDRVYNGTTNANVTYDGWLAGDNLTIGGTAAFADKNAGANKTVNVSGMSITGGSDAGNYTLANSTTTTTANIAKASLTATATGVDRVYNGTTNANVTYDGWLAGDNLTLSGTAAFADKNAGANKTVNVSGMSITGGSDAGNYTLANSTTTTTANIAKASLTATATGVDRVYNGTTNANVTYDGWLAGDNLTLSGTAAFADKNAGANKTVNVSGMSITGGSDAGNYTLANSTTTTTANIAKASLTATARGVDRVYNGTTNANVTYDGWLAGDNLTLSGTAAFADKNVGNNKTVNVSGLAVTGGNDAGNYTLANSTATTTANITPAALTVKANDIAKTEGAANPAFSATYGGLAAGDTAADLSGTLIYNTTATASSPQGNYTIALNGNLASNNYTISYANGILTVSQQKVQEPYNVARLSAERTDAGVATGTSGNFGLRHGYLNSAISKLDKTVIGYLPLTIIGKGVNTNH